MIALTPAIESTLRQRARQQRAAVAAAALALCCAVSGDVLAGTTVTVGEPVDATYLKVCPDAGVGNSGVCILASVSPAASGFFEVYEARTGVFVDDVYANSMRPLAPGDYIAYHTLAVEEGFGYAFTVTTGKVTTIKTATLNLVTSKTVDLQTQHDTQNSVPSGTQCSDQGFGAYSSGFYAFMPATYIVDAGGNHQLDIVDCSRNEVGVDLVAGKVVKVKITQ